jgi:dephospho-CoA kinase
VIVLADENKRLQWVQERDQNTMDQIKARMEKQRDFEKAVDLADFVIKNDGTLEELKNKAEFIYGKILSNKKG